jgi:hypothetical protein
LGTVEEIIEKARLRGKAEDDQQMFEVIAAKAL